MCDPEGQNLDVRHSEGQYRRDGRYPTGHYQREIPKREIIKMDNTKTSATQLDVNPDMPPPDGRYSAESHYYGSNVYQNSQRYNDFENIDIRAPLVSI